MDNNRAFTSHRATLASPQAPTGLGHSEGIANALTASAFIYAIANRFQEKHHGPLDRAKAIEEAVATLEALEYGSCRFGDPDYGWTAADAISAADEAMEYWEQVT